MNFNEQMVALKTIVIKEYLRFIRIWIQTILPPAITIALYFIIFGKIIGTQIGDINGYKYMDYIVPGLILMAVITNAYANVVSSFFSAKFHHSVEEMLVSPLPNHIILLGFVSGGLARGIIVGIVATIVSMFFSEIHIHSYTVTFTVFILTSILFSLAGCINAANLSWGCFLFDQHAARNLAENFTGKSDSVYGERFSLRHTRCE